MSTRNSMAAVAVALTAGVMFVVACNDAGDDIAGPPIPALDAAGIDPGIQAVAEGPLNAGCANCVEWSCATGTCGYDTANPPGACCTECDFGQPAVAKPSCDPGQLLCSESGVGGEYGVDICLPGTEPYGYGCQTCPTQDFICCYGGHYGDPLVTPM